MTVPMVGSELCYEAGDHVLDVGERWDAGLEARWLVEEQVLWGEQQVLLVCVCVRKITT